MPGRYVLIGQTPVIEPDLEKWAQWFASENRVVAQTEVPGGVVSTVFLGLDHNFFDKGPPLLFETMTFMDGDSNDCWRTATWLEAEEMHATVVAACELNARNRK